MSIDYDITPERKKYLDARGYTILMACPGSGKTTSIVKKLLTVSHYCEVEYGRHTGVVCLSFTNKACAELKQKYMEMHHQKLTFPNEVLTIDSFIMQYVVLPFWYLCDLCKKRPIVVNEEEMHRQIYYNNVCQDGIWNKYLVRALQPYGKLIYQKNPTLISIDKTDFKWMGKTVTDNEEKVYCNAVFRYRLEKGFITSNDALWMACNILEHHQDIAKALVMRFPYIIVDEAQDSSELHFDFLKLLKKAGLQNLEFVGDICQSIYEFNNAKPELLQNMMSETDWNVLPLSECRRSNQRIIDLYSLLKPSGGHAIISYGVEDKGIPILVYKYDDKGTEEIIRNFHKVCEDNELKDRKILARGVSQCKNLAGDKDVGFKYWNTEMPYLLIDAVFAFDDGRMEHAFKRIRFVLAELLTDNSVEEKSKFIHEIEYSVEWNARIFAFLRQIPSFSLSFKKWSEKTCTLLHTYWGLEKTPEFVPYQKKRGYKMKEMADVPVERYYQLNYKRSEYHKSIDTIHAVKGATLDAVLLFLSSNSTAQNISINDFTKRTAKTMTEKQRMIYVACSRARQFLALAVPKTVDNERIKRALEGVEINILDKYMQGELNFTD